MKATMVMLWGMIHPPPSGGKIYTENDVQLHGMLVCWLQSREGFRVGPGWSLPWCCTHSCDIRHTWQTMYGAWAS